MTFSPDGTRLASASADKTVRVWDVSTGEVASILLGHEARVLSVVFSPDGTRLASTLRDKTIRLWNASTGEELSVLRGHESHVVSVAFAPDGTRLASGSIDRSVRLWDVLSGEELVILRGHSDVVSSLGFSPDGSRLASASFLDGTIRIWDTEPYRVRYQQHQAILAARPQAERIVDTLWQQLIDAKSIAGQLRENTSLSEPQRRAALNLLLHKSVQLQDHVNAVYARLVFTDDVVAALEADHSLTPGVRYKAVRFAKAKGDQPLRINSDSWNLVRSPAGDPEAFAIGLRGAEAAVAGQPDNLDFVNTLGVAQYRNGQYEEAYATLTRCDELRQQQGGKSVPRDLAVLAMALFEFERIDEARVIFERLEELMGDTEEGWWYDPVTSALFKECRQLLEGSSAQPKPLQDTGSDE